MRSSAASPASVTPAAQPDSKSPNAVDPAPSPRWFNTLSAYAKSKVKFLPVAELEVHPACNFMPFNPRAAASINASVGLNGVLSPLPLAADGRVIGSRYVLLAAKEHGLLEVPTLSIEVDGDALTDWIFHTKYDREHLGDDERLVLAYEYQQQISKRFKKGRAKKMADARLGRSKKQQSLAPKQDSRKEAAKQFAVPTRNLNALMRLDKDDPKLYQQIKRGELTAEEAFKQHGKNIETVRVAAATKQEVRNEDLGDDRIENRIHLGEAQDVLKRVANDSASLVLFSPPYYGASVRYNPPLAEMTYRQYLDQLGEIVSESLRASRVGGRMMVVVDTTFNPVPHGDAMLPIAADLTSIARAAGWNYWTDFAWAKPEVAGTKNTYGSLASCSNPGWGRDHEWILLFFKEQRKLDGDNALCDLTSEEHLEAWRTTWNIRPETRRDIRAAHPAPFPEALAERAIKLLTYRRDLVIDPFNGSGTTTAVAKRLGRRFVGIDRSPVYCAFARQRLANTALLATDPIPATAVLDSSNADADAPRSAAQILCITINFTYWRPLWVHRA